VPCAHFNPGADCCTRGVNYQRLAGGGAFTVVMRLPCLPISNRRGETARECNQYEQTKENHDRPEKIHGHALP